MFLMGEPRFVSPLILLCGEAVCRSSRAAYLPVVQSAFCPRRGHLVQYVKKVHFYSWRWSLGKSSVLKGQEVGAGDRKGVVRRPRK